ncbi:MAG: hypothetical protein SNJ75_00115 [Gemmataceae bacterium]
MMIFAREVSDNLTSLVKAIDKKTEENAKKKMGSFVVFCNDSEKLEDELKNLAKKEKITKTILTLVDSKSGPGGYELHPDADVTVVLYKNRKTRAQFAYKKGELKEKDIEAILAALPKILE